MPPQTTFTDKVRGGALIISGPLTDLSVKVYSGPLPYLRTTYEDELAHAHLSSHPNFLLSIDTAEDEIYIQETRRRFPRLSSIPDIHVLWLTQLTRDENDPYFLHHRLRGYGLVLRTVRITGSENAYRRVGVLVSTLNVAYLRESMPIDWATQKTVTII